MYQQLTFQGLGWSLSSVFRPVNTSDQFHSFKALVVLHPFSDIIVHTSQAQRPIVISNDYALLMTSSACKLGRQHDRRHRSCNKISIYLGSSTCRKYLLHVRLPFLFYDLGRSWAVSVQLVWNRARSLKKSKSDHFVRFLFPFDHVDPSNPSSRKLARNKRKRRLQTSRNAVYFQFETRLSNSF